MCEGSSIYYVETKHAKPDINFPTVRHEKKFVATEKEALQVKDDFIQHYFINYKKSVGSKKMKMDTFIKIITTGKYKEYVFSDFMMNNNAIEVYVLKITKLPGDIIEKENVYQLIG